MHAHMTMLLQAVLEQQDTQKQLLARIADLEGRHAEEERERSGALAVLTGQVAALESKLVALERKSNQDLKKVSDATTAQAHVLESKIAVLEKKSGQDLKRASDTSTAEAKKIAAAAKSSSQADLEPLRKELAALKAKVSELSAHPPPSPP